MSGMRQKLRFTAVLVVLVIILGTASYREQGKRQKLSFPESLDLVVVTVDGKPVTLREMAFYIAYEEGNMEDAAIIYNPDNTDEYWQLYINHTFLREQAKQTVVDMTIHDTLFYQMATAEKITLSEEEPAQYHKHLTVFIPRYKTTQSISSFLHISKASLSSSNS